MADIWLLKKKFLLRPKIPTKSLNKWGLGEADRAEIKLGKDYGLGKYFQPQAGIPGATPGPPQEQLRNPQVDTILNPSQTSATLLHKTLLQRGQPMRP